MARIKTAVAIATLTLGTATVAAATGTLSPTPIAPKVLELDAKPTVDPKVSGTKQLVLQPADPVTEIRACASKVMTLEATCQGPMCVTSYGSCFPHRCDGARGACRVGACASDGDCAPGATCADGKCQAEGTIRSCANAVMAREKVCKGSDCEASVASCFPHRCDDESGTCDAGKCSGDGGCAPGAICIAGKCQAERWTCNAEKNFVTNGRDKIDCNPFRCTAAGTCRAWCNTAANCTSGHACNSDGHCEEHGS